MTNTKTEKELIIDSSHVSECTNMIKYPIITDKATRLLANNQYSFVVDPKAKKPTIKAAIQYLFNVKVIKINTAHLPKKKKRIGQ